MTQMGEERKQKIQIIIIIIMHIAVWLDAYCFVDVSDCLHLSSFSLLTKWALETVLAGTVAPKKCSRV